MQTIELNKKTRGSQNQKIKKMISRMSDKCISFELEFEDQFNNDKSESHNHNSTSSH